MFTSKKNLRLNDYQDSYYYRQQRKKRRNQWLKLSLFLIIIALMALFLVPFAQSHPLLVNEQILNSSHKDYIQGPQLIFEHPNPAMAATFPVDIEANVDINGLVAYAEIKQTFINPHAVELNGKYQFPLPENSAVKHLMIKVGDTEIEGEIMERNEANAIYQKAKSQGKKASLLKQHRPNLFINEIANIPANSTVIVTLKFIMPVSYTDGKFNFTLPLAMTKRYQAKSLNKPLDEHLATPMIIKQANFRSVARSQASINIRLNAGIPISDIFSASHKIHSQGLNSTQSAYFISLESSKVNSTKSFNLSWQLIASEKPQVSSFSQKVVDEYYTLLTFFPPKSEVEQVIARDIIFIIDTSGSMQGQSIEQAKTSLHRAILLLNDKDSFNIIAFDDEAELLFPITKMATKQNVENAKMFIEHLRADGGTQMYRPLSNALLMKKNKKQSAKAIRQIVFVTDGAVSNEFDLMQLINNSMGNFRLFTVGIGSAPNGYFMKKVAQFGRGSYVYIQNQNQVQQRITDFMTKISRPAVSDIELIFDNQIHQEIEVYPTRITDLYFGDPLQIAVKSQLPITSIQLTGETASTAWYKQLIIDDQQKSKGISSLWARRKIESLLDSLVVGANKQKVKSQVIATSLNHQIISPFTSFIALEKEEKMTSLFAKKNLTQNQKSKNKTVQSHESLLVAMPQTSLGWQLQLLVGIALIIFAKISDYFSFAGKYLKVASRYELLHSSNSTPFR